jgi:hypothetical protein
MVPPVGDHPIALRVTDDLRRTRLTVAFRLILVIPHLVWVLLWGIAAFLAGIVNWFATLFAGRSPDGLHAFLAQYLRYSAHVSGYLCLLADPYPGFAGDRPYPVDLAIAPSQRQNRLTVAFRLILAIPAMVVAYLLGILLDVLSLIAWFVCLVTGRAHEGMRNVGLFCLRFQLHANGYLAILTDRYPSFTYEPPPPVAADVETAAGA